MALPTLDSACLPVNTPTGYDSDGIQGAGKQFGVSKTRGSKIGWGSFWFPINQVSLKNRRSQLRDPAGHFFSK